MAEADALLGEPVPAETGTGYGAGAPVLAGETGLELALLETGAAGVLSEPVGPAGVEALDVAETGAAEEAELLLP